MYTAFYGLREKPFSLSPNPRFLYLSEPHREALAHLLYGIEQGEGFIAITGEVGTGKTTLCRTILERLGAETEVAFLFNPAQTADELLQAIAKEFGLPARDRGRGELNELLNRFLLEKKREGKRVLLIIDESQTLSPEILEQVRLLSNLETASSKLIQILLLGQPELDEKLDSDELRQLRQRIGVRWCLTPLSRRETHDYINHRLKVAAGAARSVFSKGAMDEIHRRTQGIPRLINVLCDRCLLAGYASETHRVSARYVKRVARELPSRGSRRASERSTPASALRFASQVLSALAIVLISFGAGVAAFVYLDDWRDRRAAASAESPLPDVAMPPPLTLPAAESRPLRGVDPAANETPDPVPPEPAVLREGSGAFLGETAVDDVERNTTVLGARDPLDPVPPFDTRSVEEATRPTPDDASFLGWLLTEVSAQAARDASLNAVLRDYELPPIEGSSRSLGAGLQLLRNQGLEVLGLESANIDMLRTLNHPVLLVLRGDDGTTRVVALRRLDADLAFLAGPFDTDELRVHEVELERQWSGTAFVLWRQFESTEPVLKVGDQGMGVLWLQRSLAELGYYEGEPSGVYGRSTFKGVRELQRIRGLEADGTVGPQTQMVLYDMLGRYAIPRLQAGIVGAAARDASPGSGDQDSAGVGSG